MDSPKTFRQQLGQYLQEAEEPLSARELGAVFGASERDVLKHLEHIDRSGRARGATLEVLPAACGGCGFVFVKRERFSRPGRCPKCKSEHILPPRFSLRSA